MCLETMHEVRVARSQKCKFAVFEGESKCCECKKITDRIDLLANVKAEPLEPPLTASDQLSSSKKPHQIKLSNQKVANKKETSSPNRGNASKGEKRLALLTGLGSISIQATTANSSKSPETKVDKAEVLSECGSIGGGEDNIGGGYSGLVTNSILFC